MRRRRNATGWVLLAAGMVVVFLPVAAVSSRDAARQTVTLVALALALVVAALTWLALRREGRPAHLAWFALAGFVGSLAGMWWLRLQPDVAADARKDVAGSLVLTGILNATAFALIVAGSRRVFSDRTRTLGVAATAFLFVGLLLWPSLLLQADVARHGLDSAQLQLRAGYRYWTVGALLLVAPFIALATIPGDWFERAWAAVVERNARLTARQFQFALVLFTLALTIGISIYSFDRRPTTADEIAQLWHARILTEGRLALPPDRNPEFFAVDNIIDRPRWFSQFPIGGPAFLALGVFIGAAWLLNPVLTALLALATYRFVRTAYGEAQGRAAAAILSLSPMILIMGATHMNHPPVALLVMVALVAFARWKLNDEQASLRWSAIAIGGSVGLALTIRPLDAVIAATVLGIPMLWSAARDRVRARTLPFAIAAGAVPAIALLWANWSSTGDPLLFGYQLLWGPNHSLGLHADPLGNLHTPWRALLLAVKYTAQLNWIVTAWPVPVVAVVGIGLLCVRRIDFWDVLLFTFVAAQILTYAFYWHDGQFVGPRFTFTAVPTLLILAARTPFLAAARARRGVWWRIAILTVPVCIGVAWLRSMRPYGVQSLIAEFRETRTRLKIDPPTQATQESFGPALIFVQEGASSRLIHRLWGLGVSRPDAARLLATADACSLAEAIRREELHGPDTLGRRSRIEQAITPFVQSSLTPRLPDPSFRVSDSTAIRGECAREIAHDYRVRNTVAYGPMLLRNGIDAEGRLSGRVIYALDLGVRNEILRDRFGDRTWFRFEVPRSSPGSEPILTPYDRPVGSAQSVRNRSP